MHQAVFNVTEFGAAGDGVQLDSPAVQRAIDAAAGSGGGRVVVPAGRYVCGTIELKSRVTLEVMAGAVIVGSGRIEDYPVMGERMEDRHGRHLIYAGGAEEVSICGGGTIDGNGPAFWEQQPGPRSWIPAKDPRVSPMVELRHCRNVRISEVTITRSPGWTVHMFCCDYVWVRGVNLLNPLFGPNTDGLDLNGCRDVVISDCHIECGDDAVVLKTTRDSQSFERMTLTNCVIRTHCAALKLGSETWHDFRDIVFSNCVVHHSPRAVGIYVFDGGTATDIAISNIVCDTNSGFILNRPIHLDLRKRALPGEPAYAGREDVFADAPDRIGRIRNVSVSNFISRTDGRIILTGADGGRLENIALTGIRLNYPVVEDPRPIGLRPGANQFSGHSPRAQVAPGAVVAENVDGLVLRDLTIAWPKGDEDLSGWGDAEASENAARVVGKALMGKPMAALHAVWARGVRGGLIDAPLATASVAGVAAMDLAECEGLVVRS